jgi:II/X family phage/plasmid replication protein
MIDWVSAVVPLVGAAGVNGGRIFSVDTDDDIEWTAVRRLEVEGSYSTRLQLRGRQDDTLEFSGNPAKFLQGHNLFGPVAPIALMARTLGQVADRLGLAPSAENLEDWRAGAYPLSRVDIAGMIRLESDKTVRKVLDLVGQHAKTKYQGASVRSGTVYIGKNSRRITLKLYAKGEEITSGKKGHGLCAKIAPEWRPKLLNYGGATVRVELTLRGMELKARGLDRASHWSQAVAMGLLRERMNELELNDTVMLTDDLLEGLPGKLVAVYDAWKAGRDIQKLYSRRTFYRYRAALLPYGIDIARVQPRAVVTENQYPLGISLRQILSAPFEGPPEWAIGTELLAS